MDQERTRLAYRWQYHAISSGLGLLSLGLMVAGRRGRRAHPAAGAVTAPWVELSELAASKPDEAVRPPWADRLETERAVLRIAVSAYLGVRAHQLARRDRYDISSRDGQAGS